MTQLPNRLPPLGALRAFEAVARLGSLSLAADELNVTKSAVSHQLRALETDFGIELIHRGGTIRRAEVSENGVELLAAVQQALALLENACIKVRREHATTTRHVLNVSANPSFAALWLAPRVGRFIESHPDIDVQVHLHASHEPAWKAQNIDLAFLHTRASGTQPPASDDLPLMTETVIPVCSPTLVPPERRNDVTELLRHRWLQEKHADSPETDWATWRTYLGLEHSPARDILTFRGLSTVAAAAVAGVGIALGRSPLIDEDLASGRLVPLLPGKQIVGSWGYVMRKTPHRAANEALPVLLAFLEDEVRNSHLAGLAR